jgi:tetratricopeptide (TPR) repeat protein
MTRGDDFMRTVNEALSAAWDAFQAKDLPRAEQIYRMIVQHSPAVAHAWYMLGAVQQVQGRLAEAVASYQEAIRLVPEFPEACNNLGVALHAMGRGDEAIATLRRALALRPDYPEAHNNLGNAFHERGALDEAETNYRRAVQLRSEYNEALNNLGNVLRSRGRIDEALACYDRALGLQPDQADVHLSRALAWLERGEFERGWPEYEWRLKCRPYAIPSFPQPLWDGRPLEGRTILLYADHGLGDALQFIRYAPLVHRRGGRVIVMCGRPLARLLATCPGVEQVMVEGEVSPDSAVYAPLMSLPGIFGTTLETIPAEVPYLFPDEALVERRDQLPAPSDELRVGIAWQGNPRNTRDRARSFHLSQFEPIARQAGIRLFSLQTGYGREQLGEIGSRFEVTDVGGGLGDFLDTATAMANLDLIIAPDTAVAHLAGALGVPVWVALPFAPDWRWMSGRDDSPWYPTMKLFRQRRWGDWDEAFARIAGELADNRYKPSRSGGIGRG